jgi:hypothetical protein
MTTEEEVNWPEAVLNCEWRIGVLELVIDRLIEAAPEGLVTPKRLEDWRREALAEMRIKYPKFGLDRTKRIHLPENLSALKEQGVVRTQ